jgi:NAD(P)-dependent dehydrogenase (short-subunit alcohol dehydrogenase family)
LKIAVITGTNSGFGLLTSIELAKAGYFVFATMRDLKNRNDLLNKAKEAKVENQIECVQMDITKSNEVEKAYEQVRYKFNKIDLLINNAGYAQGGFFEEVTDDMWIEQFQTNVFGHIRVTRTFLPLIQNNGGGKIINISSVSGLFGFPGLSPYTSSKFALEGWSESLRLELLDENIWVTIVEPASYQTNIWKKGLSRISKKDDRSLFQKKLLEQAEQSAINAQDPIQVVQLILKIVHSKRPKLRYPIGGITRFVTLGKALIPWRFIETIVIKAIKK